MLKQKSDIIIPMVKDFPNLTVEETQERLKTSIKTGLTEVQVKERLKEKGPNKLKEKKAISPLVIFAEQFKDFLIWVLIAAAVVSGLLSEWIDSLAIITVVLFNAIIGFLQQYKAEKSLEALKKLSTPSSKAIRDGRLKIIPSPELVFGDLIEIEAGDAVPADCRLIYITPNFSVEEASLTGESAPVAKTIHPLEEKNPPLADRANMVYMGTSVSTGKARALVADTGMSTELGKIAGMIQEIKSQTTPLQKKIEEFGKFIVYACAVIIAIITALELWRGGGLLEVFLTSVSLAVAAIPEGLPAVVAIALAIGVQRMVKRNAIIRKLPSVETLGCATVICSDKTGTLTKNEMTVTKIFTEGAVVSVSGIGYEPIGNFIKDQKEISINEVKGLEMVLKCGTLCCSAELSAENGKHKIIGDPTEGAILVCAGKGGIKKQELERDNQFFDEIPFDSERKKMTVLRKSSNGIFAYIKGAPDSVIPNCSRIFDNGVLRTMTSFDVDKILEANSRFASQALRVLAVGYRQIGEVPSQCEASIIEKDIIFAGLIAMIDPPREEVKDAIKMCKTAGIRTIMITGDHKNTAVAIGKALGMFGDDSLAITGEELDKLSDQEFSQMIKKISVYARVSPSNKLRIVSTWRQMGEIVAMTGDGVNDAPAVKEADIGVSMGITGTDVTKEVSDMVITDDNFASIVSAVREGRGIYANLKKSINYLLSCNIGEVLVMFFASILGIPIPLLPIQILWVNLVTDSLPALSLGVDPPSPHIMEERPREKDEPIVTKNGGFILFLQGLLIAVCSLSAFCWIFYLEQGGVEKARTAAFVILSISQLFHAFNGRSNKYSIFKIGIFSNMALVFSFIAAFALQALVVYLPFFQVVFKTQNLSGMEWLGIVAISIIPLVAVETVKFIKNLLIHA